MRDGLTSVTALARRLVVLVLLFLLLIVITDYVLELILEFLEKRRHDGLSLGCPGFLVEFRV